MRLFTFAFCLFCLTATVKAQQVIGTFPSMDGGMENQTAGNLTTGGLFATAWSISSNTGGPHVINATGGRSGPKYCNFGYNLTATKRLQSPIASVIASTQYTVQFYYKTVDATAPTNVRIGIGPNGTTTNAYTAVVLTGTSGVWTKVAGQVNSPATQGATGWGGIQANGTMGTATIDFDDFVVYAGLTDITNPDPATASATSTPTSSSLDINWTAPVTGVDGGGYIVVRGTVDPTTAPNQNGIYAIGNTIGSGTVAYIGTGTSFTDNGLNPSTTYFYRIYTVDKAFNYATSTNTSGTTGVLTLDPEPTVQASNLVFSAVTSNSMTLTWTNGDGASRIVLAKSGSAVSSDPIDGNGYTANSIFGTGALIGAGNYVIYSSTGNSVTVTGLSSATVYHFAVYEFNGAAGTQNYLTTPALIGNQATEANTIISVQSGNWGTASTWLGAVVPTAVDNVIIDNTHTVVVETTPKNCYNLTINGTGKLWANAGLTTNRYLRIYGPTFTNNGQFGDNADGLGIEVYLSNGTQTYSGSGVSKINRLRPGASIINSSIVFNTDVLFTYTGSAGTGGAGLYTSNSANDNISITVNAGKTVTFNPFSNMSTNSSVNADGSASQSVLINGSIILGADANMNIRTVAAKASTLTVNGSLVVGNNFLTDGATVPTITVGAASLLEVRGTSDLTNPSVLVSGAGTYTQASGTLMTGNVDGANLSGATGVIRTATRNFDPSASFTYNGIAAQTTGTALVNATNLSINNAAGVTLTNSATLSGTLSLTTGILKLPASTSLRITSGNAIAGGPFSSAKYIVTEVSGNNLGVLRIDNLPAPAIITLFPVGSPNYYLPVSLNPASTVDHVVSVFEGVTEDGTPLGTPFTPAKKADVVDAVWIVNRPNGTGNCTMELGWNAALEGAKFATFGGANMGISRHDGAVWSICFGAGDNTLNTATAPFGTFSPFGVGYNGAVLASQIKNIAAYIKSSAVEIKWEVANEAGILLYEIEKSINRVDFSKIGSVNASGKSNYIFLDPSVVSGVVYYRIKIIGLSGDIKYTDMVIVRNTGKNEISLYPNPVINSLTISGLTNTASYKLINAVGQVVLQQKTNANSMNIDVSTLQPGLYFVEVVSKDGTSVKQSFVKQ